MTYAGRPPESHPATIAAFMSVPLQLRTERLFLRPWRAEDAPLLLPVLQANQAHLGPWIPARVAEPAPVPELALRLEAFGANFAADREWRYGVFTPDEQSVLGEVALFPRAASGRVPFVDADRSEIGYWLRQDLTRGGLATEGARAVLAVAATIPQFRRVEIRCDARNVPSAALPQRLGFTLTETITDVSVLASEPNVQLQVWTLDTRSTVG